MENEEKTLGQIFIETGNAVVDEADRVDWGEFSLDEQRIIEAGIQEAIAEWQRRNGVSWGKTAIEIRKQRALEEAKETLGTLKGFYSRFIHREMMEKSKGSSTRSMI